MKKNSLLKIIIVLLIFLIVGLFALIGVLLLRRNSVSAEKEKNLSSLVSEEMLKKDDEESDNHTIVIEPGGCGVAVDTSIEIPIGPGASETSSAYDRKLTGEQTGVEEHEVTLSVAKEVKNILEDKGYTVILTRDDAYTCKTSQENAEFATENNADIFVRLFIRGTHTINRKGAAVYIPASDNTWVGEFYQDSYDLGRSMLNDYCKKTGFDDCGIVARNDNKGINYSTMPVAQLMLGCILDADDEYMLADEENYPLMAEGIADGIDDYFADR